MGYHDRGVSSPGSRARRSVQWFGFPIVLAAASLLVACEGDRAEPTVVPVPVAVAAPGADLYARLCARCHGAAQEGKEDAPALDAVRIATLGDQRLRQSITYGKGRMKGYAALTSQELEELVAYLQAV